MKILVVEDNEDSRILLESALGANGYQVQSAENGKSALSLAVQNPPDLIISDILMPEMDGYSLCKAVKKDERLRTIPFVFYTATYTDPSDEKLAMDLGASKFIIKPMEIDAFLLEIENILETHQTERLQAPEPSLKSEKDIQNDYTKILAKKLDRKIRQLKEEQIRLAKSEKKYRRLVEVLRDDYFFYTYDTGGAMTYISPSITHVLGYGREDFQAHFLDYLTTSPMNATAVNAMNQSIRGIKQPPYEIEILHKSGDIHRLEVTEEPIFDKKSRVSAVEGIAHDITKRILAEKKLVKAQESLQQSQKMEAIGTLAGGIAHDFNNILTPIIGYTEITRADLPKGSKNRKNLQEVLNAANRARELVIQILTFSRQAEKEKKPVHLHVLIKETLKLLRSSIPTTIEIRESIDSNCDTISANPTQIHQIVMNLCTNAYHAMRHRGGILSVSLSETNISPDTGMPDPNMAPGRYLRLDVSDTGTGIEKNKLENIFDPYYTTKPKDEGTGLGLSVVHGIVTSHSGHIGVSSEPGRGTTFHVYLPVISTHHETLEAPVRSEKVLGGTERILLIDDEEIIGRIVTEQLKSYGYQVIAFTNGLEAMDQFQKAPHDIDLIITDMTMPRITGLDLAKKILKIRQDTPIILCTGFNETVDKEKAFAVGIRAFFMKPVNKQDLAMSVRKLLDDTRSGN
jgi:PAS domain S-box-containing protein